MPKGIFPQCSTNRLILSATLPPTIILPHLVLIRAKLWCGAWNLFSISTFVALQSNKSTWFIKWTLTLEVSNIFMPWVLTEWNNWMYHPIYVIKHHIIFFVATINCISLSLFHSITQLYKSARFLTAVLFVSVEMAQSLDFSLLFFWKFSCFLLLHLVLNSQKTLMYV